MYRLILDDSSACLRNTHMSLALYLIHLFVLTFGGNAHVGLESVIKVTSQNGSLAGTGGTQHETFQFRTTRFVNVHSFIHSIHLAIHSCTTTRGIDREQERARDREKTQETRTVSYSLCSSLHVAHWWWLFVWSDCPSVHTSVLCE